MFLFQPIEFQGLNHRVCRKRDKGVYKKKQAKKIYDGYTLHGLISNIHVIHIILIFANEIDDVIEDRGAIAAGDIDVWGGMINDARGRCISDDIHGKPVFTIPFCLDDR